MIIMYDSISAQNLPIEHLPVSGDAYAGYVGGFWPDYSQVKARFPHARVLSIAISSGEDAECLDIENGDASPADAPAWVKRQHTRGEARPCLYASVAVIPAVLEDLHAARIAWPSVRLWSAHYGAGRHICGPHSCNWPGVPALDGTQWTNTAAGEHGSLVDESLLLPDFFGTPPKPPVKVLDGYLVLPGAAGGFTGRAVTSDDAGKTWK